MNIYLIGYRCTGKTTAGRLLAQRLGWAFVDADEEIVRTHGMTVSHIVAAQGWEGFRAKEKRVLERICGLNRHVVATGGGVVIDSDNVSRMRQTGFVCWLAARPETIRQRLKSDETSGPLRPALTSQGTGEEIEAVLADRAPLYRNAADAAVDTDESDPEQVVQQIVQFTLPEAGRPKRS